MYNPSDSIGIFMNPCLHPSLSPRHNRPPCIGACHHKLTALDLRDQEFSAGFSQVTAVGYNAVLRPRELSKFTGTSVSRCVSSMQPSISRIGRRNCRSFTPRHNPVAKRPAPRFSGARTAAKPLPVNDTFVNILSDIYRLTRLQRLLQNRRPRNHALFPKSKDAMPSLPPQYCFVTTIVRKVLSLALALVEHNPSVPCHPSMKSSCSAGFLASEDDEEPRRAQVEQRARWRSTGVYVGVRVFLSN